MKKFLFVCGFLMVGAMLMPANTEAQSSGGWREYSYDSNLCYGSGHICYPDDIIVTGKPEKKILSEQ